MNKIVKIETEQKQAEIDWDEPQYMINQDRDLLLHSTGQHSADTFEALYVSGCVAHKQVSSWKKSRFRPLAKGEIVTVQFSND